MRLTAAQALEHPWMRDELTHLADLGGARDNMRDMRDKMRPPAAAHAAPVAESGAAMFRRDESL